MLCHSSRSTLAVFSIAKVETNTYPPPLIAMEICLRSFRIVNSKIVFIYYLYTKGTVTVARVFVTRLLSLEIVRHQEVSFIYTVLLGCVISTCKWCVRVRVRPFLIDSCRTVESFDQNTMNMEHYFL